MFEQSFKLQGCFERLFKETATNDLKVRGTDSTNIQNCMEDSSTTKHIQVRANKKALARAVKLAKKKNHWGHTANHRDAA